MKNINDNPVSRSKIENVRRSVEATATFGLLLVLVAMVIPFAQGMASTSLSWARWIYAAGALIYTVARVVNVNDPADSIRLRRLRRLEFWAGMCFIVGAAFWFYRMRYFASMSAGTLAVMQQTVAFTMAGAAIQIIASWMISSRMKKERALRDTPQDKK